MNQIQGTCVNVPVRAGLKIETVLAMQSYRPQPGSPASVLKPAAVGTTIPGDPRHCQSVTFNEVKEKLVPSFQRPAHPHRNVERILAHLSYTRPENSRTEA
jgi:hypothetical protein